MRVRMFVVGVIVACSAWASAAERVTPAQISARRAQQRSDARAYSVGNFFAPVTNKGTQSLAYARGEFRAVAADRLSLQKENDVLRKKGYWVEKKWNRPSLALDEIKYPDKP